jgi:hypothetical protein
MKQHSSDKKDIITHEVQVLPNTAHQILVDSDGVRRRSQLRVAPSEYLCPRLYSLQIQATREPITTVVGKQVLEEQILHHKSQHLQ